MNNSTNVVLQTISPGEIFQMGVYDCFEGDFKLLKKALGKIYVEIIDVCMCYRQQVQSQPGERYWIEEGEIAEIKKKEKQKN